MYQIYVAICKRGAGFGLHKSTVFYMDLPVLKLVPKSRYRGAESAFYVDARDHVLPPLGVTV